LTVDFEGVEGEPEPDANESVVYYPNTAPPLTTSALAFVEEEFASGVYSTTSYEGTNALKISSNPDYDSYQFYITVSNSEFLGDNQSFTVEFFARLGASLSESSGNASYSGIQITTQTTSFDAILYYADGGVLVTGGAEQILQVGEGGNEVVTLTTTQATTVTHISVQYIAGSKTVVHYGGSKIYDESVSLDGLDYIILDIGSLNVSDPLLSQIRLTAGARYGDSGTISIPSYPFFTP
jgi:hypothetical protein